MSDRATERDGEHVTAIKSDETGRWVRIPDGVDGVRAYQLLRAASTDAPEDLPGRHGGVHRPGAASYMPQAHRALNEGEDDESV